MSRDRRPTLLPPQPALVAVTMVVLLAVTSAAPADVEQHSLRTKRAVGDGDSSASGEMEVVKVCHNSTPCGWAVYVPPARNVEYFVRNTCECSKGRKCTRAEDDLSVKAFVYRCSLEAAPA